MGRNIRSFIFIAVLFIISLSGCGMPRMFSWSKNEEYRISSSQLDFNLSYTYYDRDLGSDRTVQLTPLTGTPVMHFYYCVSSSTGLSGFNMSSAFTSSYSSRYVPVRDVTSSEPIASDSVTLTSRADEVTTSVGLYEFIDVATGRRPDFPSDIDDYLDSDETTGSGYLKHLTYKVEPVQAESSGGYYFHLTINPDTEKEREYLLARFNGAPFRNGISNYLGKEDNGDVREYSDEDDPAGDFILPTVYIYASATFLFEGYTTVSTIELAELTTWTV